MSTRLSYLWWLLFFAVLGAPLFAASPAEPGLIGNWSPGIGDPSPMGWATVAGYLLAALGAFALALKVRVGRERVVWGLFALLFLFLGVNKQLDLQTAFTEFMRIIAKADGWYRVRHTYQRNFIMAMGAAAVLGLVLLGFLMRRLAPGVWISAAGACLVIAYVLVRAASFHKVDIFIHSRILGLKWNWILELGGLFIVLLGEGIRALGRKS